MSIPEPGAPRKVVAFCPWVKFRAKPFDMCGVRVMGFGDAEAVLSEEDRTVLWRASAPYGDHFLNKDRTPRHWNNNPLLYAIDSANPFKEPSSEEARLIALVNSYLYLCTFATNRANAGGLQVYTSASDWALYFHPVQNPEHFALGERRLYGEIAAGGYRWDRTLISQPIECNRCELFEQRLDRTMVEGVTALNAKDRAVLYLSPVRTFMLGTGDNHLWRREDDLPFIWGGIEQMMECEGFESCGAAQREVERWAQALKIKRTHSTVLVRAVVGSAPAGEYVWEGDFRPGPRGGERAVTAARSEGVQFSVLERALDELNFARNGMVHGGFCPPLEWNLVTLAFLGSRFWIALFKRILSWEGVCQWADDDECEVIGLQALASYGQASFVEGYKAYETAVEQCRSEKLRQRAAEYLGHLLGG